MPKFRNEETKRSAAVKWSAARYSRSLTALTRLLFASW
jgi:hypothetical protein